MTRWLVTFRSHAEGPADVHYVDVYAEGPAQAVRRAQRECPPLHPWCLARALPWPSRCRDLDAAIRSTGTA